jgi:uncharacterized protein DUF4268
MAVIKYPWQNDSAELISSALDHLHNASDSNRRIAFLLLDVGVETLIKTYLILPERAIGTKISFADRQRAIEGNFHDLCDGIERAAGKRLQGIDLARVQYYHGVRNTLYHEAGGITVSNNQLQGYAELAVELLKRLLDVDLSDELKGPVASARQAVPERSPGAKQRAGLHQQFFTGLLDRLKAERTGITNASAVDLDNWFQFSAGRAGFSFGWWFRREGVLSVDLYIDVGDGAANKGYFDKLSKQKDEIEKEIGLKLSWERMDHARQSRVGAKIQCRKTDTAEQLAKAQDWALDMMLKFIDTFQPRIKKLEF